MKKIAFILALVMILSSALWGCDTAETDTTGQAGDSSEDINKSENTDEIYEEIFDTSKLPDKPYYNLQDYSIWYAKDGEYYVYIKSWDTYRKIEIPHVDYGYGPHFETPSSVINENSAVIAVYNYEDNYANITVCHFNRNNEKVETYTVQFTNDLNICPFETVLVNMIEENKGCFTGVVHTNYLDESPIIRFVTEDGGKTWNKLETLDFNGSSVSLAKFVSREVGIISYRYQAAWDGKLGEFRGPWEDVLDKTYVTTDGGLSWNRISLYYNDYFPYDAHMFAGDIAYAEVFEFDIYDDDHRYMLGIRTSRGWTALLSNDLINWEFAKGR